MCQQYERCVVRLCMHNSYKNNYIDIKQALPKIISNVPKQTVKTNNEKNYFIVMELH